MGKTSYLFKKIRDTKGTFHPKMGTIKDRNGKELEAERLRRGGKKKKKEEVARTHGRTAQERF